MRTLVIGGGNSAADVIISILKEKRTANDKEPIYWATWRETFDVNKETAQRWARRSCWGATSGSLPGATPRIGEVDDEGVDRLVIRVSEDKSPGGIERYNAMSFPMKNVIACIGSQGPLSIFDTIGVQTIACAEGVCQVAKEGDRLSALDLGLRIDPQGGLRDRRSDIPLLHEDQRKTSRDQRCRRCG